MTLQEFADTIRAIYAWAGNDPQKRVKARKQVDALALSFTPAQKKAMQDDSDRLQKQREEERRNPQNPRKRPEKVARTPDALIHFRDYKRIEKKTRGYVNTDTTEYARPVFSDVDSLLMMLEDGIGKGYWKASIKRRILARVRWLDLGVTRECRVIYNLDNREIYVWHDKLSTSPNGDGIAVRVRPKSVFPDLVSAMQFVEDVSDLDLEVPE